MSECSCPAPQPWGWNHVPLPSPEVISAVPDPCSLLNKKNLVPSLCSVSSVPPRPLPELAKTQGRGDGTATGSAQGSKPLQAHTHTHTDLKLAAQPGEVYLHSPASYSGFSLENSWFSKRPPPRKASLSPRESSPTTRGAGQHKRQGHSSAVL